MTWQESVHKAIQRYTMRTGSAVFTRQEFLDAELGQIVLETGAVGETPHQTLSRVLQELRNQGVIEFEEPGVYRLL